MSVRASRHDSRPSTRFQFVTTSGLFCLQTLCYLELNRNRQPASVTGTARTANDRAGAGRTARRPTTIAAATSSSPTLTSGRRRRRATIRATADRRQQMSRRRRRGVALAAMSTPPRRAAPKRTFTRARALAPRTRTHRRAGPKRFMPRRAPSQMTRTPPLAGKSSKLWSTINRCVDQTTTSEESPGKLA